MNDMEKCFYEPAELSVVDEGKGHSLVREKGSPYKRKGESVQAGFPCGTSR